MTTATTTTVVTASGETHSTQHKKINQHRHTHDECDVIGELMGQYGKYQFYMTFLLSLFQIPNTFHIASPVYQVSINQ